MKKVIVFDMDGTLADIGHRLKFVKQKPKNWPAFVAGIKDDKVNIPVVELYKTLWDSGRYELIIVSGRGEESRPQTEAWLTAHNLPFGRVLMRKAQDYRTDSVVKGEILDALLAEGREILFTVDDRNQVVEMWRSRGITCLQCAPGDF